MLTDRDWEVLLERIQNGKCTPFLGAGANVGVIPGGRSIAKAWAAKYGYPLKDDADLARVSQFLAVTHADGSVPKDRMRKYLDTELKKVDVAEWLDSDGNPLAILADLPLPVYLTTNYDDLMYAALKRAGKQPAREICRWNSYVAKQLPSIFDRRSKFFASDKTPVVYHLHGHKDHPDSLVLTEDDYLDFLIAVSKDQLLLPARIQEALTGSSLLFVGYRLADINFKVLFRGLISSMEGVLRKISLAVQLLPEGYTNEELVGAQEYLNRYFGGTNVKIYWGDAAAFARELRERWRESGDQ